MEDHQGQLFLGRPIENGGNAAKTSNLTLNTFNVPCQHIYLKQMTTKNNGNAERIF